jgi:hypothetical protein
VAFSPDGKRLAAASGKFKLNQAGEVRVWDVSGLPALPEAAPTAKQLEALFADLGGADAEKAYRAVWALAAAPREALPFLKDNAKPPTTAALDRIPKLIKELDDESFEVRENASAELERLGTLAVPALREALKSPSAEVVKRAEALLDKKPDTPPVTAEELKVVRVVEALQLMGTAEVKPVLEKLASGPAASLATLEAKAALARLKK